MLNDLNVDQARFIALLATAARAERDTMLGHGPDRNLNPKEATPTRGERNPGAELGFDPLSEQNSQLTALRDALATLTEAARSAVRIDADRTRTSRRQEVASRPTGSAVAW